MSYSRDVVSSVKRAFEEKRASNEKARVLRLEKAYSLCPKIKEIDDKLSSVSGEIITAISLGKERCSEEIEKIKERNLALQKKRGELLIGAGLCADYTDIKHDCELCGDTGFVNGVICKCYKTALTLASYEKSGLSRLLKEQSFDTFSFEYYSGREKEIMEENYRELLSFAKNFENDKRSFLLFGATGLGKTHLSTAVAKYLLDNGYDVVYELAQNVFSDFERDRAALSKSRFDFAPIPEPVSDRYLNCDLLILDDLGTEMVSQFSVSCLYNIINTRLNKGLPIIASTNLRSEEIRKMYHDRITSRLFGEFSIMQFLGQDIRRQKILK